MVQLSLSNESKMSKPAFAIHGKEWTMYSPSQSMLEIINDMPNAEIFLRLLKAHNLETLLQGDEDYTVFVPIDEFFLNLSPSELVLFLEMPYVMDQILRNQFVRGKYIIDTKPSDVISLQSIQGSKIIIENIDKKLIINSMMKFYDMNIKCKNGVIHLTNIPIIPDDISS